MQEWSIHHVHELVNESLYKYNYEKPLQETTYKAWEEIQVGNNIFKGVATLALGSRPKLKGLQGCGPRGRKPESQGKGIARVRAKRKPGSHITYSWEC
jgi:hypothetical protein